MAKEQSAPIIDKKAQAEIAKSITAEVQKAAAITKKSADDVADAYAKANEEVTDFLQKIQNGLKSELKLKDDIARYDKLISDYAQDIQDSRAAGLKDLEEEAVYYYNVLKSQRAQAKNAETLMRLNRESLSLTEEQQKVYDKNLKLSEKYDDVIKESLSFVDDISTTIEDIPIVGGVLSKMLGAEELKEKLHEIATENLKKLGEEGKFSLQTVAGGFTNIIKKAGPMLPLILGIAGAFKLIEFAVDIDKETTELARNLGISKDEAHELHHSMIEIQRESGNALMTIKNMSEAMTALSASTGLNTSLTKDMLQNQVLLTNNLGIAAAEAAALNSELKLSGKNVEATTVEMYGVVEQFNNATHAGVSVKDILTEVAKVSSKVKANFRGNFKELTLQVAKAKALGLTLDKIYDMGRKSLDIESSVTAEFEASALLGKSINLNAFRQASLAGDTAAQMQEISKYAGSYTDFLNMNVLQREKLAEAFGMEADGMADMLKQQDLLNALGATSLDNISEEQIRRANLTADQEKELRNRMQLSDVTDKLAKATESIKNIFAGLAGLLQPVLDIFVSLLDHSAEIKALISGIATTVAVVMAPALLQSAKSAGVMAIEFVTASIAAVTKAIADITSASALTLGLGAIGIAAGIGVGVSALKSAQSTASVRDGIISPDGGLVVSGEKGTYKLHENDTVIAGTSLGEVANGSVSDNKSSINTTNSTSRLESLLEKLLTAVDQPVQIVMGGKVIDELDNRMTLRKTYTTKVDSGYGVFG